MADIIIGERWSTDESLDMALGVRRAIDCVLSNRQPPAECGPQLQKGVDFLSEAKGGFALVTGKLTGADSFNGTFSPLCLTNDVYIRFRKASLDETEETSKVGVLLDEYKSALECVKREELEVSVERDMLKDIAQFFEVLTDLLLQQADPMTREFSRPCL